MLTSCAKSIGTSEGAAPSVSTSPGQRPSLTKLENLPGGGWVAVERSAGGIAEYFAFHANGTFYHGQAAVVDFRYTFDGSSLVLVQDDIKAPKIAYSAEFRDGALILRAPGLARPLILRRSLEYTSPNEKDVVGVWDLDHPSGKRARFRLLKDGRGHMVIPLQGASGKFEAVDGKIALVLDGQAPRVYDIALEGDDLRLNLTASQEPAKFFKRVAVR